MKRIILIFSIFVLFACSSKEEPGDVIFSKFERIHDVLTKNTWKVSEFSENDHPSTANFENYIFRFNTDQTLVAEKDSVPTIGSWIYKSIPFEGELLEIELVSDSVLDVLSESWKIESVINKQVKLMVNSNDVSKKLTFERL